MSNYIDGFVHPIPKEHLEEYKNAAQQVAEIWKEYGAISYFEFYGDEMTLEGTRSFIDAVDAQENEEVVFGWVVFPSKEVRDSANAKVPMDERMKDIVGPLCDPERLIFDFSRMLYGGFKALVESREKD